MSLFPLFAVMLGVIVFDTVVILYLYAKYKNAKYEAFLNRPPF
jgi:hypothetical protein